MVFPWFSSGFPLVFQWDFGTSTHGPTPVKPRGFHHGSISHVAPNVPRLDPTVPPPKKAGSNHQTMEIPHEPMVVSMKIVADHG